MALREAITLTLNEQKGTKKYEKKTTISEQTQVEPKKICFFLKTLETHLKQQWKTFTLANTMKIASSRKKTCKTARKSLSCATVRYFPLRDILVI